MRLFIANVIYPNLWRYLFVIIACFAYAFGLSLSGPRLYRSEAVLAFKNRTEPEKINWARLIKNPLPIYLEEIPIETQYDIPSILYSINLANRAIGDDFNNLYDPEVYDGLYDFYDKFLSQLGYEYDGERNVLKLNYTYKDPEKAAMFLNGFAQGLEDFMVDVVSQSYISPIIRYRISELKQEASKTEEQLKSLMHYYDIPDILKAPPEWVKTYLKAKERAYKSEIKVSAASAALKQITANQNRRNLLKDPKPPPDTTIIQDLVLSALRIRYALIYAKLASLEHYAVPDIPTVKGIESEQAFIKDYIEKQYSFGIDIEKNKLFIDLNRYLVEKILYEKITDEAYSYLEKLPSLEAEIRPVIRRANYTAAAIAILERHASFLETSEEYGIHPVKVIDAGIPALRPIQPAWRTLALLLPTILFLATLWFAFIEKLLASSVSDQK